MSNRILQVNKVLIQELAGMISRDIHLENGLITITRVKCSPDLKRTEMFISVLPENNSGTALSLLRKSNSTFQKELRGKIKMRTVPKLYWKIDEQERYALEIDKVFDEINKENASD